jgi:hypothetical protein
MAHPAFVEGRAPEVYNGAIHNPACADRWFVSDEVLFGSLTEKLAPDEFGDWLAANPRLCHCTKPKFGTEVLFMFAYDTFPNFQALFDGLDWPVDDCAKFYKYIQARADASKKKKRARGKKKKSRFSSSSSSDDQPKVALAIAKTTWRTMFDSPPPKVTERPFTCDGRYELTVPGWGTDAVNSVLLRMLAVECHRGFCELQGWTNRTTTADRAKGTRTYCLSSCSHIPFSPLFLPLPFSCVWNSATTPRGCAQAPQEDCPEYGLRNSSPLDRIQGAL